METEFSFSFTPRNLWLLALGIPILLFQYMYIQYHLPLIRSGLAAAEKEGPDLYKRAGVPPGATASSPLTMSRTTADDPESMWGDEPLGLVWEALWDAPGDRAGVDAWYKDRLQADGWKVFRERKDLIPADVLKIHLENAADPRVIGFTTDEIEFRKDKWRLSIEHKTTFDKGRPPHARFLMRLMWDY
jgi:hypothetical protein